MVSPAPVRRGSHAARVRVLRADPGKSGSGRGSAARCAYLPAGLLTRARHRNESPVRQRTGLILTQKVFVAGASGAVGRRLCRLLVGDGWIVTGTTRSPDTAAILRDLGVMPVVVDVFEDGQLRRAVAAAQPEMVVHQLTDLPPALDPARMPAAMIRNDHIREVGTRNLLAASVAAGVKRVVAQSIAFAYSRARPSTATRTDTRGIVKTCGRRAAPAERTPLPARRARSQAVPIAETLPLFRRPSPRRPMRQCMLVRTAAGCGRQARETRRDALLLLWP